MKKTLLLFAISLFSAASTTAQVNRLWSVAAEKNVANEKKVRRSSFPETYAIYKLDLESLKNTLRNAPVRGESRAASNVIVSLPNAEGKLENFRVLETPIMEPELAAKYPTIKSYVGKGIDDPTAVARFSVTEFGLHSMTLSAGKSTAFIDPFTEDRSHYIVYNRASLRGDNQTFECLTDESKSLPSLTNDRRYAGEGRADTNDRKLRTYRLAQSCTAEYGNLFDGADSDPIAVRKGRVQAQMAITMTRVNGVYENDLAITMIFVANNDLIIYIGNTNSDPWNGEFNTTTGVTIDANIGFNNYDIGHNFNTSGGGNAGCIGCVCSTDTDPNGNHKGTGMTGRANPTGDAFDIDYVAHEMGHQFGGYHTQSSSGCRSGSGLTEVEPGSGSTIMAYAGICNTNVQSNSDAYFAYVNIRDILENVRYGVSSTCAQLTDISNNPPTANAGRDYVIPRSTAFVLEGQGTDPDGGALTYTWEQNDPENPNTTAAPTATRAVGPMFRSIWGTSSPKRYMPNMTTILSGATSNTWEVCPSVARDLNFSLTVRDNDANVGQTASDLMKVTVNGAAGPFAITVPNTVVSWAAGTNQTVTWNVAGTTANNINCAYVDIYLSTNGGTSFDTLLASKVPNDGSETITVPNTAGTTNRIMVRGWDNIFLDVSNTNFTITAATSTMAVGFNGVAGEQNKSACQGTNVSYSIDYKALAGFSGTTTFTATGNPAGSTVTFVPSSLSTTGTTTMTISNTAGATAGFYTIVVTASSGAVTKTANFYLDLLNSNFTPVSLTSPANNAINQGTTTTLTWAAQANASSYDVQVASDNAFTNIISSGTTNTTSYTVSGLLQNTDYYWRVLPKNVGCSGTFSSAFQFRVGTISCAYNYSNNTPVTIPTTANVTRESTITVPAGVGAIEDINVTVNITHTWISDLTGTLVSPTGEQVILFQNPCPSNNAIEDITATFDDSGVIATCGVQPGLSGTIRANGSLASLIGKASQGDWKLRILDSYNQDGGAINSWSINICGAGALSTNSNVFNDLKIYPNPNNGDFNIQFNPTSNEKITIGVHDLRGRLVYEKSFANQGIFSQTIQLNNVQSGIYLVSIQEGDKKDVKKIIVN